MIQHIAMFKFEQFNEESDKNYYHKRIQNAFVGLENKIPELLVQFNETLSKGFDGHHFIAGLASHFRDLLVCHSEKTIELLEVGEDTKD